MPPATASSSRSAPVSGYGNYIRIKHTATYATAYGHISRFAGGLHVGSRVHQGQVIAYVGMTGRATGPHLHYEVLVNGKQINPQSVKLPTGEKLAGQGAEAVPRPMRPMSTASAGDLARTALASGCIAPRNRAERERRGSKNRRFDSPSGGRYAASATVSPLMASLPSLTPTWIVSPGLIRPSRIRPASGFCSSRWITRFSGRAP